MIIDKSNFYCPECKNNLIYEGHELIDYDEETIHLKYRFFCPHCAKPQTYIQYFELYDEEWDID